MSPRPARAPIDNPEHFDEAQTRRRNLKILGAVHPGLPESVGWRRDAPVIPDPAPLHEVDEVVRVVGPTGEISARIGNTLLHSMRNPREEARRLLRSIANPDVPSIVVFSGYGLGYLPEEFLTAAPDSCAVIIEPNAANFVRAAGFRDMSALFSSRRASYVVGSPPDAVIAVLKALPDLPVHLVQLRALYELTPDYFVAVSRAIESYATRAEVNRNTLVRFSRTWVRNLLRNLPIMEDARSIDSLRNRFSGLPGILIGGGPTVDEVLPYAQKLRNQSVVVAVDTGLAACYRAGVSPDFLVVVDPQYWNTRHLDFAAWEIFPGGSERPVLISESSAHPRIFRSHYSAIYFCSSLFPLGSYIESRTTRFGALGAGGSVATSAWDFLRILGCSPILCAGVDLGFPGGQTHFRGSFFEDRILTLSSRMSPAETPLFHYLHDAGNFSLPSYSGEPVMTDRRMSVYRWWFEGQMREHPEVDSRSLSSRSVRIDGFGCTSPQALLYAGPGKLAAGRVAAASASAREKAIDPIMAAVRNRGNDGAGRRASVRTAVADLVQELNSLRETAMAGIAIVEKTRSLSAQSYPDQATSQSKPSEPAGHALTSLFRELDRIDAAVIAFPNREILGFLLQKELRDVEQSRRSTGDVGTMLETSEMLYRALEDAARYHIEHLNAYLARNYSPSRSENDTEKLQ